LFCFVLFCFVLFCFVLFCFVLFCFVLFCFVLFFVCLFPCRNRACDMRSVLYFSRQVSFTQVLSGEVSKCWCGNPAVWSLCVHAGPRGPARFVGSVGTEDGDGDGDHHCAACGECGDKREEHCQVTDTIVDLAFPLPFSFLFP
jgi:hypothetical protein